MMVNNVVLSSFSVNLELSYFAPTYKIYQFSTMPIFFFYSYCNTFYQTNCEIIAFYRRCQLQLLTTRIKDNFPLYFIYKSELLYMQIEMKYSHHV
jgi:hypothetical protein